MNNFKQDIYLKKNIKLSNQELYDALENGTSTKNIDKFENFVELYYNYYEKVKNDFNNMLCYHEISTDDNSMICLFFDIDIPVKDLSPIETLINIFNKNNKISDSNNDDISDLYLLKKLLEKFCKYLYENNKDNYETKFFYDNDYININDISYMDYLKLCYKHLAITKNINSEEKYSYHVYFNNILFNIQDILIIKNLIKNFINSDNNPFITGIDIQVYKKKISLRTIYSKKTNDEDFNLNFHYPIYVKYKNNKLIIEQDRIDINEKNLNYYFCTINNIYTKKNYLYIHKIHDIESSDEETKTLDINTTLSTITPNIKFLTLKDILTLVFNTCTLASFEIINFLENLDTLNTNTLYIDYINKNKELTLNFNYNVRKCLYCKKKSHKNKHIIIPGVFGINLIKKGNINSCKIQSIPYRTMSDLKICEYIYKQDVVKKTSEGNIIYFLENEGWKNLENNMFSGIKNLMKSFYENFRNEEILVIDHMNDKKIKENFMTLTSSDEKVNTIYPYMFKFKNGILDLKTNNFIELKNSKHIYLVIGVNYEYIKYENYTEDQIKKYNFLENIIDQIMPPKNENNEINYYREIFECNTSSCLAKDFKDIITVFEGPTLAGKSTIKHLICSSLGDKENFIDIPISVYAQPINPKIPDPWLGQIENKCVSFASEPGFEKNINTQAIKLLTESRILLRKLYSNDIGQINFLSQFIDTNYNLKFDVDDPAVYRRWAVIKFTSHFQNAESGYDLLLNNIETCNKYIQIKNLKSDIIRNEYALDFFHILHKWFKKYHINGLKMRNTAEISPFYIINKCINNMTISGSVISTKQLKTEKVTNYYKVNYRINYNKSKTTLAMTKRYFITYFEKFLQYKKIEYDLNKLVSELVILVKTIALVPIVLIEDIKEDQINTVIENYKSIRNAKNNNFESEFDLTYYKENKFIFNIEHLDDKSLNTNILL